MLTQTDEGLGVESLARALGFEAHLLGCQRQNMVQTLKVLLRNGVDPGFSRNVAYH